MRPFGRIGWKKTVWFRLTVGSVCIIPVANVVLSLLIILSISGSLVEEVQARVRLDLNSARRLYDRRIDDICLLMRATSTRRVVPTPLESWEREDLHRLLQHVRQAGKLDIIALLETDGRVVYRENNPDQAGDDVSYNPIVSKALRQRKCFRGTAIVPYKYLEKEGADLVSRTSLETSPTLKTTAGKELGHRDAMVIGAAVPLADLRTGRDCVGFLYGARLLNQDHSIVDEIKQELYQDELYRGVDVGAATIFHRNIRISTSMKSGQGFRAVGTFLSPEVYKKVLERKENWADRALVVNDWYITAYEPILDPANRVVGALGVGTLEAPFVRTRRLALGSSLAVVAFTSLVSLLLLALATGWLLRPIGRIVEMSNRVAAGDLSARVGIRPPGEMGFLCQAIDQMADAVTQREEALKQTTRRQIGQSEKLAAVGRMAAGIAHEINNPLTGLLTFEHLLKDEKGLSEKGREYLDIMHKETSRMRGIVLGLLNFARESPTEMTLLDVNEIIRQSVTLLRNQKKFNNIAIKEELASRLPSVDADANQLQQVLVNLCLNACEAMPKGGTLTISTCEENKYVVVSVADTGCGIEEEHLEKVFDPFFTTKPVGKGTGLGLSVSYGIIRQHGGVIKVESQKGQGTVFTFTLPVASR
ncbi:MAG: cache domain-containing protein [Deltaproteobacteria bacterium]|nr:cache domain-containing protein [Deltaproteobacteria bacterium]